MRGLVLVGLATLWLGGCASTIDRRVSWSVAENSHEGVKLGLGVPDTDDVHIMMTCSPRSSHVDVMVAAGPRDGAVVELRSGKITQHYAGAGLADEESLGRVDLQFKADAADPVLRRFGETGELTVVLGRRRMTTPNGFAPAHDFIAACRARRGG